MASADVASSGEATHWDVKTTDEALWTCGVPRSITMQTFKGLKAEHVEARYDKTSGQAMVSVKLHHLVLAFKDYCFTDCMGRMSHCNKDPIMWAKTIEERNNATHDTHIVVDPIYCDYTIDGVKSDPCWACTFNKTVASHPSFVWKFFDAEDEANGAMRSSTKFVLAFKVPSATP